MIYKFSTHHSLYGFMNNTLFELRSVYSKTKLIKISLNMPCTNIMPLKWLCKPGLRPINNESTDHTPPETLFYPSNLIFV